MITLLQTLRDAALARIALTVVRFWGGMARIGCDESEDT